MSFHFPASRLLRPAIAALFVGCASAGLAAQAQDTVSTIAGDAGGLADGPAAAAQFSGPSGVAVDAQGNLYVADSGNHRIRKISRTPQGPAVSTLAGSSRGTQDGPAAQARFNYPTGVAVDGRGNVYVAEYYGHRIRKIDVSGPAVQVRTVAGRDGGFADGPGEAARFNNPTGVAIDAQGQLYVADRNNHRIRRIAFDARGSATVSTVAGGARSGDADGPAASARFRDPMGVAVASSGEVYVADRNNHRIRAIRFDAGQATVRTLAGSTAGFADGPTAQARFNAPYGVAVDGQGQVLVVDSMNNRIRAIAIADAGAQPRVTTLAGSGTGNSLDGPAPQAAFDYPNGVAVDNQGTVYIAEDGGDRIRRIARP